MIRDPGAPSPPDTGHRGPKEQLLAEMKDKHAPADPGGFCATPVTCGRREEHVFYCRRGSDGHMGKIALFFHSFGENEGWPGFHVTVEMCRLSAVCVCVCLR